MPMLMSPLLYNMAISAQKPSDAPIITDQNFRLGFLLLYAYFSRLNKKI